MAWREKLTLWRAPTGRAGALGRQTLLGVLRYCAMVLLPLMVLLSVRTFMLYQEARGDFERRWMQQQQVGLSAVADEVHDYLSGVVRDVRYLALSRSWARVDSAADPALAPLQKHFAALLATRADRYEQIRYLSEGGQELVRVDNVRGEPKVLPQGQLQNKSDRYYVREGLSLKPAQVYMSRLDLNVEHGQVEKPFKPMLRFVTRVYGPDRAPQGLLVINVQAAPMLAAMRAVKRPADALFWLLTPSGHWLIGSEPEDEWGFMFPQASNTTVAERYPAVWDRLHGASPGNAVDLGLMVSARIRPQALIDAKDFDLQAKGSASWLAAYWLPKPQYEARLNGLRQDFWVNYISLTLVFLVLSLGLGWLLHRRELAVEVLRQRQAQFQAVLMGLPDPMVVTKLDGSIVMLNAQAQDLFDCQDNALLGRQVGQLFPHGGADLGQSEPAPSPCWPATDGTHLWVMSARGVRVPVVLSLKQIETFEGPRVIGILKDVREQLATERALQRSNQALSDTNRQLEVSNLELESFASSVSHDLRAHVRAIEGYAHILLKEQSSRLDEQGQTLLNRCVAVTHRMNVLIEDLLALSRVARIDMQLQDVDLSAMARSIVRELRAQHPERQVDVQIAADLHAMVDEGLARIILTNLLDNAWKFTGQQPQARIEFGVDASHRPPRFFLRDNGAGFDMAYADKLFKPFQRLHDQTQFPGTGVGLATVMRAVYRHHGTIQALAEPGRGAEFRFTLGQLKE